MGIFDFLKYRLETDSSMRGKASKQNPYLHSQIQMIKTNSLIFNQKRWSCLANLERNHTNS